MVLSGDEHLRRDPICRIRLHDHCRHRPVGPTRAGTLDFAGPAPLGWLGLAPSTPSRSRSSHPAASTRGTPPAPVVIVPASRPAPSGRTGRAARHRPSAARCRAGSGRTPAAPSPPGAAPALLCWHANRHLKIIVSHVKCSKLKNFWLCQTGKRSQNDLTCQLLTPSTLKSTRAP